MYKYMIIVEEGEVVFKRVYEVQDMGKKNEELVFDQIRLTTGTIIQVDKLKVE